MHTYNPHTFLDYYASSGSDSTHARDYCILSHWQVVPTESLAINRSDSTQTIPNSNSIIFLSFSHDAPQCPENEPEFTRENLILSVWLLEPVKAKSTPLSSTPDNEYHCRVRYASSINFIEDLPTTYFDTVTKQHALFPAFVGKCLDKYKSQGSFIFDKYKSSVDQSSDDSNGIVTNDMLEEEIAAIIGNSSYSFSDDEEDNNETNKLPSRSIDLADSKEIETLEEIQVKENFAENADGEVGDTEMQIDTTTSSSMSNAILLLSCSGLWLCAKMFSALYPYRGLFFLIPFFSWIWLQIKVGEIQSRINAVMRRGTPFYLGRGAKVTKSHAVTVSTIITFLFPTFCWYVAHKFYPSQKEVIFLLTFYFAVQRWAAVQLGSPIFYSDGSSTVRNIGVGGHVGLGTGKSISRFGVELKGVLRYIKNKKEENRESSVSNNELNSVTTGAEIAVSHIVVKAIARTMSEMSIFNTRRASIPLLGIQGFYQRKSIDISVVTGINCESKGANHAVLLENVDSLSVREIANHLLSKSRDDSYPHRRVEDDLQATFLDTVFKKWVKILSYFMSSLIGEKSTDILYGTEKFGSCVVLTSPNSENSDVDIEVCPASSLGVNMVVVVGSVRVIRDTKDGSIRPALSMSINIDCPPASVASCRKFSERVQRLIQFPEICDDAANEASRLESP